MKLEMKSINNGLYSAVVTNIDPTAASGLFYQELLQFIGKTLTLSGPSDIDMKCSRNKFQILLEDIPPNRSIADPDVYFFYAYELSEIRKIETNFVSEDD